MCSTESGMSVMVAARRVCKRLKCHFGKQLQRARPKSGRMTLPTRIDKEYVASYSSRGVLSSEYQVYINDLMLTSSWVITINTCVLPLIRNCLHSKPTREISKRRFYSVDLSHRPTLQIYSQDHHGGADLSWSESPNAVRI